MISYPGLKRTRQCSSPCQSTQKQPIRLQKEQLPGSELAYCHKEHLKAQPDAEESTRTRKHKLIIRLSMSTNHFVAVACSVW